MYLATRSGLTKWNLDRCEPTQTLVSKSTLFVTLNSDENKLAAFTADKEMVFFDLSKEIPTASNPTIVKVDHQDYATMLITAPDQDSAITCCIDGTLRIWSFTKMALQRTIETLSEVYTIAYSQKNQFIVSAGARNKIRIWDFKTGKRVGALKEKMNLLEKEIEPEIKTL